MIPRLGVPVLLSDKRSNLGKKPNPGCPKACAWGLQVRKAAELGVLGINKDNISVDFGAVMKRMRRLRAEISQNDSAKRFSSDLGVDVYQARYFRLRQQKHVSLVFYNLR
jgi:pyruvate/2-oxoglutarate dehydrogenase complex dihydrolipoamide dehydrogenase (E3) component